MGLDELDFDDTEELDPELEKLVDETLDKIRDAFKQSAPKLHVAVKGTFSWALMQMNAGKTVRRVGWDDVTRCERWLISGSDCIRRHWHLPGGQLVYGDLVFVGVTDLFATDWQIYEEK